MTTQKRAVIATLGVLCGMPAMADELKPKSNSAQVKIEELNPFTHSTEIVAGTNPASIRFKGAKLVKVATELKSTIDERRCQEADRRDPGGSTYCSNTQFQSPSAAYQVTYSYSAEPLASDEYRNPYFTFSVYFRPEELTPGVREKLSSRGLSKTAGAELFHITTQTGQFQRIVIDEAASKLCERVLVEGFVAGDSTCVDQVKYAAVRGASDYVTVRVGPGTRVVESNK